MTGTESPTCTHTWKTCPVHSLPDGKRPPFRTVLTCNYGGTELEDGGTWDETTSDEVANRLAARLERFLAGGGPRNVVRAIVAAIEVAPCERSNNEMPKMICDERGRFVGVDEYAGCPAYEKYGDCRCSTGVPGWGCDRALAHPTTEEPTE